MEGGWRELVGIYDLLITYRTLLIRALLSYQSTLMDMDMTNQVHQELGEIKDVLDILED